MSFEDASRVEMERMISQGWDEVCKAVSKMAAALGQYGANGDITIKLDVTHKHQLDGKVLGTYSRKFEAPYKR